MYMDLARILAGVFRPKALSKRNAELVAQYFGRRPIPHCCCLGSVVAVEARLEAKRDVLKACWACLWDMKRLHRNAGKEEDVQLAARALGYNVRNGFISEADLGALWAASVEGETPAGSYEERMAAFNARDADEEGGRNKAFDAGNDWGWFQVGPPQEGKRAMEAHQLPDVFAMDDGEPRTGTSVPGGIVTSVNLPGDQLPWGSKKDVNWRPVVFRHLPAHPYKTRSGAWNWQPDGAFKRALYRLIRRLTDTTPRSLRGNRAVWGTGAMRVEATLGGGKCPTTFQVPAMLILREVAGEDEVLKTALVDVQRLRRTGLGSTQSARYRQSLDLIRKLQRVEPKFVVKAWGRFSDVIRGVLPPPVRAPKYKPEVVFERLHPEAKALPEPVVQWSTKY